MALEGWREGIPADTVFVKELNEFVGAPIGQDVCQTDYSAFEITPYDYEEDYPRIRTPFLLNLIRRTYYAEWLRKVDDDSSFRNAQHENYRGVDFSLIRKVDVGGHSREDIFWYYAFGRIAQDEVMMFAESNDESSIHLRTILFMVNSEYLRLGVDKDFLIQHFHKDFVSSLRQWHKAYIEYLICVLRSFKGFENYQIGNFKLSIQQKIISEVKGLTYPTDMGIRQEVKKEIQKCRATDYEYGRLLYRLQYAKKYFTIGVLSRNDYYRLMQQIGKIKFGQDGDYSNCNRGYNKALTSLP